MHETKTASQHPASTERDREPKQFSLFVRAPLPEFLHIHRTEVQELLDRGWTVNEVRGHFVSHSDITEAGWRQALIATGFDMGLTIQRRFRRHYHENGLENLAQTFVWNEEMRRRVEQSSANLCELAASLQVKYKFLCYLFRYRLIERRARER